MIEKRTDALLQPRDLNVLRDLFECRVMSLAHVTALHFEGKKEAAKKRIQRLKESGFIRERPRSIGEPSLLHLTKKGFLKLHESGGTDGFPQIALPAFEARSDVSAINLRHELEVMDVRVAFYTALTEQPSLSIAEFTTWPALAQFTAHVAPPQKTARDMIVKPDGFLRVREQTNDGLFEHMFFLEVDRSTESLEVIARKAVCYLDFYQSGGMAARFGAKRADFRDFPFRVLMVFRNAERRNNVAEKLLRNTPPILTQVWLSTLDELKASPLSRIWIRPKDYARTREGYFSGDSSDRANTIYRRDVLRDSFVSASIEKLALLEDT